MLRGHSLDLSIVKAALLRNWSRSFGNCAARRHTHEKITETSDANQDDQHARFNLGRGLMRRQRDYALALAYEEDEPDWEQRAAAA